MLEYGKQLGVAFQLIDDVLDYSGDPETMGKNMGDDLAEGKVTLPLIHVLNHGSDACKQLVREAITHKDSSQLTAIIEAINACGALEHTRNCANEAADQALSALNKLPETPYRQALERLALMAVERDK